MWEVKTLASFDSGPRVQGHLSPSPPLNNSWRWHRKLTQTLQRKTYFELNERVVWSAWGIKPAWEGWACRLRMGPCLCSHWLLIPVLGGGRASDPEAVASTSLWFQPTSHEVGHQDTGPPPPPATKQGLESRWIEVEWRGKLQASYRKPSRWITVFSGIQSTPTYIYRNLGNVH